ncbi:MAG: SDR family oxidoreductase [Burkholderiales bacterium]|nr:SDR family oxidoreductase [Burkholderiales bacterium]
MVTLITGASGLLGATLAPYLKGLGYTVLMHGKSAGNDVSCDLTDKSATRAMLEETRPNIVVNLVALTNVDKCEESPHDAYLLNVRTVENLVAGMRGRVDPYLIQISTDQVYDSIGPSPEDEIRLTNTYALTKYAGELAAARMPSTILRTNFFGHSALPGRKSFSDWLLESLRNGDPISVFTDVVVNPLALETLSAMIGRVIERRVEGVFNLGSRGAMSKADFAFELARIYGLSIQNVRRGSVGDMNLRAYRPRDMSMDCSRFEAAFDVELPTLQNEICELKRNTHAVT